MPRLILVLDTPNGDLRSLGSAFGKAMHPAPVVERVLCLQEVLCRLAASPPVDLVALDCVLGDGTGNGLEALRAVRTASAKVPVIAVAERGDVATASQAIEAGATDFLVRGERLEERVTTLLGKVGRLLRLLDENRVLGQENARLASEAGARFRMVGKSPQMLALFDVVQRVASIPRPVLIVGERGTGKELVARAIHELAAPSVRPFVVVNCAAFPDTLLENELFGHERGAYTGAERAAAGRFEQASGGTLFLDEIGHMTVSFQQKILRVVEYSVFSRVGGRKEIQSSARIVAATNADLERKMDRGEFLRDLYDRLSFEVIRVPPLRERAGDVELLAEHFLAAFMKEVPALAGKRLTADAVSALRGYGFPGNVRELKNLIERAAYRDSGDLLSAADLQLHGNGGAEAPRGSFEEMVAAFQRRLIEGALDRAEGNQAAAARALGLTYAQFRYYWGKREN